MEDISIIVPVYNHERTLTQTLESILAQEMSFSRKIYCLNDASTDGSAAILEDFARRFPGLFVLYQSPKNLGSGKASHYYHRPPIKSRYWCILEGDDNWISTCKLKTQIEFLDNNPDFVGCSTNTLAKFERTNHTEIYAPAFNTWNIIDLLPPRKGRSFYVHTSSIVWRNIFKENGSYFPPEFEYVRDAGDVILNHMMLHSGGKMKNIGEEMSCYRISGIGRWSGKSPFQQRILNWLQILKLWRVTPFKYKLILIAKLTGLYKVPYLRHLLPQPLNP